MIIGSKNLLMLSLAMIGALAILITAWVVNGSEHEDAWLYVFAIWLVIYSAVEAFSHWKKNNVK